MCSYIGKYNRNISSLPDSAMQIEIGVMVLRNMLDDRQPQPGAAGGLGTALVHPEKPFKHPCLILRGNPDSSVFHGNCCAGVTWYLF